MSVWFRKHDKSLQARSNSVLESYSEQIARNQHGTWLQQNSAKLFCKVDKDLNPFVIP